MSDDITTRLATLVFDVDRLLAVDHRDDDRPCACDECMSYGAEDNGADWYTIPPSNRIAIRILDSGDDRFTVLAKAFRDHQVSEAVSLTDGGLREAGNRLSDAISNQAAIGDDGLFGAVAELDARIEYLNALKAFRAALVGEPKP